MRHFSIRKNYYLLILTQLLISCGDDGIEGGGIKVNGTAATGQAISQRQVTAKSLEGNRVSETTAENGKFSLAMDGEGPILLKIDTEFGAELYSIADESGTTNIHPFTDLIIRNWFSVQGLNIDTEFASNNAFALLPTAPEIEDIQLAIKSNIDYALIDFFLPEDINVISYDFDADGTGFDGFLDYNQVIIANNEFTIVTTDPDTSFISEIITDVGLDTDLTTVDSIRPSVPNNLRAVAVSIGEVSVVWEAASDNIGVAGYNIYRNGSTIPDATTPYPAFADIGLQDATEYCYEVEAIDGAGNVSITKAAILQSCPVTGVVDIIPPPAPTLLQASAETDGSITLSWTMSDFSKVIGFHVYRGTSVSIDTINNIATVTSASYTDYNLDAATEYCYKVSSYGVDSFNESLSIGQVCATTF